MEGSPQANDNHLEAIGNLLFSDGPQTPEEHLEVIKKGLGEESRNDTRAATLEYAHEHLEGEQLVDVQLTVAETAATSIDRQGNERLNAMLVDEVLGTVVEVAASNDTLSRDSYKRSLTLLSSVAELSPINDYHPASYDREGEYPDPVDLPQTKKMSSGFAREIFGMDITKRDLHDVMMGDDKDGQKAELRVFRHVRGLVGLSIELMERAQKDHPNIIDTKALPGIYFGIAEQTASAFPSQYGRLYKRHAPAQALIDKLVDKGLEVLDEDTPDAVEECLDIENNKKALDYSHKERAMAKALDITKKSSREEEVEETRSFFGFKRTTSNPSLFEKRRSLLQDQLSGNFQHYLNERPETIQDIMGLYSPETEADKITRLWSEYSQEIANHSFMNGHYNVTAVKQMPALLSEFSKVAPESVANSTQEVVKERLLVSSPNR